MRDIDVLMLAQLVLSADEMDECFLRAFHKLPQEEQSQLEDDGWLLMARSGLVKAEDAMEVLAKAGMHMVLHSPNIAHRTAACLLVEGS